MEVKPETEGLWLDGRKIKEKKIQILKQELSPIIDCSAQEKEIPGVSCKEFVVIEEVQGRNYRDMMKTH